MLSSREYAEACGTTCPHCGDADILAETIHAVEGTRVTQGISCSNCGFQWTELYRLTGFTYKKEDLQQAQAFLVRPSTANVTVEMGVAHLPDGRTVDLLAIQRSLVGLFQNSGFNVFPELESQLARITGLTFGPQEQVIAYKEEE